MATLTVTGRADLTDAQWAVLEPLLPRGRKPGRPPKWTKRQLINGIRWRVRAGAPWRDVPPAYGPWPTVYGLFRRWQRDGTWREILTSLQARADAAGLITWDVSVDSTTARAHQHAAGARKRGICRPSRRAGWMPSPLIMAWAVPAAGSPPRCTWPASRARNPWPSSSPPASAATAPSSRPSWAASASPAPAGPAPDPPAAGTGRQGLRLPRQPRLPAAPWDPVHHPGKGRPDPPPQEQGQGRRPPTSLRPRDLQAAPRCRVRDKPAQTQPRRRHPLRQARRPLRSHRPHRRHQRMAAPLMKHALVPHRPAAR